MFVLGRQPGCVSSQDYNRTQSNVGELPPNRGEITMSIRTEHEGEYVWEGSSHVERSVELGSQQQCCECCDLAVELARHSRLESSKLPQAQRTQGSPDYRRRLRPDLESITS